MKISDEKIEALFFICLTVIFVILVVLIPARSESQAESSYKKEESAYMKKTAELVASFEGFSPVCEDHLDGHATIGYGHLLHFGPCSTKENEYFFSKKKAKKILLEELDYFKKEVLRLVAVPLSDREKIALISFAYNVGPQGLADSDLLYYLNQNKRKKAKEEFTRWVHGPYGYLPGLLKRREKEARIFAGEI